MEARRKTISVVGFKISDDIAFDVIGMDVISHLGLGGKRWWEVYADQTSSYIWIHNPGMIDCFLTISKERKDFKLDRTQLPKALGIVCQGAEDFRNSLALFQVVCSKYLELLRPRMSVVDFENSITFWSEHWRVLHIGEVTSDVLAGRIVTI